jgi:hypothetical protein
MCDASGTFTMTAIDVAAPHGRTMANIRTIEMLFLDDLLEMGDGYVLQFNNPTFSAFFRDELGVDIDNPAYSKFGTSKAKRLRCFLQNSDKATVARALRALWEYREAQRERAGRPEKISNAHARMQVILARLDETSVAPSASAATSELGTSPRVPRVKLEPLRGSLLTISALAPQPRGYAFERFLRELFDAFGLQAREPFRLRGEQIDGSFQFANETYLLEAKWQNGQCDGDQLHGFHGKLEQKAAWARGLYVSDSGFSEDGLHAFGRAKRLVCMDGLDLYEMLDRELPMGEVLDRKVRRAAETGLPFVRVRDLFPASKPR